MTQHEHRCVSIRVGSAPAFAGVDPAYTRWRSIHAAARGHAARRLALVTGEETAALVGEADDRIGVIGLLIGLERLRHRVALAAHRPQPSAQADAHELEARWDAE